MLLLPKKKRHQRFIVSKFEVSMLQKHCTASSCGNIVIINVCNVSHFCIRCQACSSINKLVVDFAPVHQVQQRFHNLEDGTEKFFLMLTSDIKIINTTYYNLQYKPFVDSVSLESDMVNSPGS